MDQAIIAVVGALLGVVVGAGLEALREREQWRRQEFTRWRTEKLELYSSWLNAAREVERWGALVAISSGLSDWLDPRYEPKPHERNGWDRWQQAHEELRRLRGQLELIGSPAVRDAADHLTKALDVSMRTHIDKILSRPRVPGDDVPIGDILRGLAQPSERVEPDPGAQASHQAAIATTAAAFEQFRLVAREEL